MTRPYSKLTHNYASHSQGVHGAGARTYKPEMATRVLFVLRNECLGPLNVMTVEALATRVGLNGRAVRDIVRDLEVSGLVLTDFAEGYYICETAEQAERSTRRLESQVANMQERIEARRKMVAELVRLQRRLL